MGVCVCVCLYAGQALLPEVDLEFSNLTRLTGQQAPGTLQRWNDKYVSPPHPASYVGSEE